jgi:hypothetical protein
MKPQARGQNMEQESSFTKVSCNGLADSRGEFRASEQSSTPSNLLTIPTEIRLKIWELVIGGNRTFHPAEDRFRLADDISGLFLACRTIYEEAAPFFYSMGHFDLRRDGDFECISKVPTPHRRRIKRITMLLVDLETLERLIGDDVWIELEVITIQRQIESFFDDLDLPPLTYEEEKFRFRLPLLVLETFVGTPSFPKIRQATEVVQGFDTYSDECFTPQLSGGGWRAISGLTPMLEEVQNSMTLCSSDSHVLQEYIIDLAAELNFSE